MLDKDEKLLLAKLFGRAVRELREKQGLKRMDLARRMSVQHTRVAQIENGKVDPQVSTVLAVAEAMNVAPSALLDDMAGEWVVMRRVESGAK